MTRTGALTPGRRADLAVLDVPAHARSLPDVLGHALFESDAQVFRGSTAVAPNETDFRFVRFRPPALDDNGDGVPALPHIRLDRAMQFLFGDRLR